MGVRLLGEDAAERDDVPFHSFRPRKRDNDVVEEAGEWLLEDLGAVAYVRSAGTRPANVDWSLDESFPATNAGDVGRDMTSTPSFDSV